MLSGLLILCIRGPCLRYLFISWWTLRLFHFLPVVNSGEINMGAQMSAWQTDLISLEYIPSSGIGRFWGTLCCFLQWLYRFKFPGAVYTGVPFSSISLPVGLIFLFVKYRRTSIDRQICRLPTYPSKTYSNWDLACSP